jgi:hypothetical protein
MANQNLYGTGTSKRHRDRKNETAAEAWRKVKHERNTARGKQMWVEGQGWTRISVA